MHPHGTCSVTLLLSTAWITNRKVYLKMVPIPIALNPHFWFYTRVLGLNSWIMFVRATHIRKRCSFLYWSCITQASVSQPWPDGLTRAQLPMMKLQQQKSSVDCTALMSKFYYTCINQLPQSPPFQRLPELLQWSPQCTSSIATQFANWHMVLVGK